MTIKDAMKTYRLPRRSTPEELEYHWTKVLTFGNKVLLAGNFYQGVGKPCYYGAVYEFQSDDRSCEGDIIFKAASEVEFEDDGHAIAWAMEQ